jgi:hypothetical protein
VKSASWATTSRAIRCEHLDLAAAAASIAIVHRALDVALQQGSLRCLAGGVHRRTSAAGSTA